MNVLSLATIISLVFASPAAATVVCGKAKEMISAFKMQYSEVPMWRGTTGVGTTVVILESPSGTWTALQIKDEIACVVSSGEKSELAKPGKPA